MHYAELFYKKHVKIEIFAGEHMSNKSVAGMLDANFDLDILLFRGSPYKDARSLTRRANLRAGCECAKEKYENAFNRLSYLGLCNVSTITSRNKKKMWFLISCH